MIYGCLAGIALLPLLRSPAGLVVGATRSDVWNSLWSHWWVAHGLAEGRWPITTELLAHPDGGRLLVADPLGALLAAPLVLTLGPVLAYNLCAWLHCAAAGLAAHAMARRLGGQGWLAGAAFCCSPLLLAHLNNGASEAFAVAWVPLAGLAMVVALQRGGWARITLAGLALAVATVASWYTGLATWLLAACLLVVGVGDGTTLRCRLGRGLPALALAATVCAPFALWTWSLAQAPDGLVQIKADADLHRLRRTLGPADPRVFLTPGSFRSPDFATLEGRPGDYANVAYLGWVLLLAAVLPRWTRRGRIEASTATGRSRGAEPALWMTLLLGVLAALGPVLVVDGLPLDIGGRALPLPYRLVENLPGFAGLSLLWRLALAPTLALALLADRAASRLPTRVYATVLVMVLLEVHLLSPARGLPAVSPVPRSEALEALAEAPPGAVLNLPVAADRAYLYEQVLHGKPLAASLNSGATRPALELLAELRRQREGNITQQEFTSNAQRRGIRYVVIHRNQLVAETFIPAINALRQQGEQLHRDDLVEIHALW